MRQRLLTQLAGRIPASVDGACVLVGIDGPDGSGKTTLADELATALRGNARPVVRISIDDFHHPQAIRYRLGRESPVGFWVDSYDYPRVTADVLDPLGPAGDRWYRAASHDLQTDTVLDPPWQRAPEAAVVVVDGLFLHRDGLVDRWDFSVYLDVPFSVTATRMAGRDGTASDPDHPSMRRYVGAQRIYLGECSPMSRATVVVDNTDVAQPVLRTVVAVPEADDQGRVG